MTTSISLQDALQAHDVGGINIDWPALVRQHLATKLATETSYRDAWKALSEPLSWMHGNKAMGAYWGRNLADIANDLIDRAYPGLRVGELAALLAPTTPAAPPAPSALVEKAGLSVADTVEAHMRSSGMIWSLGKDLPDDWFPELRSILVAALGTELSTLAHHSAQPASERGWRSMDDMPRDGTYALLRFPGPFNDTECPGVAVGRASSSGWWLTAIWAASTSHHAPDAWMPLPAPASEAETSK